MVALFHFNATTPAHQTALLANAWLFVDFFFVLSGFVIAANYADRLAGGFGRGRFMVLRLGRLYPLHFVLLVAFVASEAVLAVAGQMLGGSGRSTFTGQTDPWAIVTNLFLVQGIGFHEGLTWNGVAWSISTEMFAYLAFAVLAVAFPRRLHWAMLGLIAVSLPFVLPEAFRPAGTRRFVELARCLYGFGVGVLLNMAFAWLVARGAPSRLSNTGYSVLELVSAGLAIAFVSTAGSLPVHLLAPLAFAPAVMVFAFDQGWISQMLKHRWFVLLGTLSYSIYMIHPFVQSRILLPLTLAAQKVTGFSLVALDRTREPALFVWGGQPLLGTLLTLAMLAVLLVASLATYRWIEAPGRAATRRYILGPERAKTTDRPPTGAKVLTP